MALRVERDFARAWRATESTVFRCCLRVVAILRKAAQVRIIKEQRVVAFVRNLVVNDRRERAALIAEAEVAFAIGIHRKFLQTQLHPLRSLVELARRIARTFSVELTLRREARFAVHRLAPVEFDENLSTAASA